MPCGCSRRPATAGPRWAPPCGWRRDLGDRVAADARRRFRALVGRGRARSRAAHRARATTSARATSPTRWPRCSPTTVSSRGSRAPASTARARSGAARCSPIRGARRTSSASTTSRAASSSARWRRWCSSSARRSSSTARFPVPTCSSPIACATAGASASPRSSTSTAPRASRPSSPLREPLVAAMLTAFERRTGVPVVVNTSLNTAGRPMVDDPRDALECFGSAPVDALALGPVPRPARHRSSPAWPSRSGPPPDCAALCRRDD